MKISLLLALVFGCVLSFASQTPVTKKFVKNDAVKQKDIDLKVSLAADKHTYKPGDRINLDVKLINSEAVKDVFVYGTLQFGVRASFTLYRRDARGKEVPTRFIDSAWEIPPKPDDTAAFVKLLPFHFLGTTYMSTIYFLHMEKPGKYRMWVEYNCPLSTADVKVSPFWGSENGTIKSNVVSIEVLR